METKEKILVIAELMDGKIPAFLFELISAAQRIQDLSGNRAMEIIIMVPDPAPFVAALEINKQSGLQTIAVRWPDEMTPESLQQGLAHVVQDISPAFVIMSQTTIGREVAPCLGARLGASVFSGITDIQRHENRLVFYRLVMDSSRLLALYPAQEGLCILTLPPGTFPGKTIKDNVGKETVSEMELQLSCLKPGIKRLSMTGRSTGGREMQSAKIVVGAGRGIGPKENLKKIETFTSRFAAAYMGASRPLVDMGWVPYSRQVGITGATITPDLYIACGISGSSQHLAGMAGAKWVVSINTNPDAPICRHADLSIVADVNTFIEAFMESR
jgi:electron transfer flavoprotein alpha subunit